METNALLFATCLYQQHYEQNERNIAAVGKVEAHARCNPAFHAFRDFRATWININVDEQLNWRW